MPLPTNRIDLLIAVDPAHYLILILDPSDIERWRNRTQTIYRIPYYNWTLLAVIVTREEYPATAKPIRLIYHSDSDDFRQLEAIQKCTVKPYEPKLEEKRNLAMISTRQTATPKDLKLIGTINDLCKQARQSFTGLDGNVRTIGYIPLNVPNMLTWINHNRHNRPVNWSHIQTLIANWQTDWIPEVSILSASKDQCEDGQHRPIAYVLAFGNVQEIAALLEILGQSPNTTGIVLDESKDYIADPVKYIKRKIGGYEPWGGKALPTMDAFVPVQFNVNPRVGEKADTDLRKRTGADMLARNSELGNVIAQYNMDPKDMQEILRIMYLRCLPPSTKAAEEGDSYGTLRKGGNIQPARYIALYRIFEDYICDAMAIVHGSEKYAWDCFPIPHNYLVSVVALAIQGGVKEAKIKAFCEAWGSFDKDGLIPNPLNLTGTRGVVARARTAKDKRLPPWMLSYVASRYIQAENHNPSCSSLDALLKSLGKKPEQESTNRLPGWDSQSPPCKEIMTDSLVKKLKAETKKAEKTKAGRL
jgi:hypothetical protein